MKTILVAEDEQFIRWSVSEFLRREHFEVTEAEDGLTAIELIEQKPFDVVISDYRMPGEVNGLEVLRRYHELRPEKLSVLISAEGGKTKREIEAIGGIYLQKPVFLEELLGVLSSRPNGWRGKERAQSQ